MRACGFGALAFVVIGCATDAEEPKKLGPPDVYPVGGTGGAAGAGGASCVPPSDASADELGLHATLAGEVQHFTRDVSAVLGFDADAGYYEFSILGWKEPGVCGQSSLMLTVISEVGVPSEGVYECVPRGEQEPTPYIVTTGAIQGRSSSESPCTIELTEVESGPGANIAGTFSGTLLTGGDEPLELTDGSFRVLLTE